MKFQKVINIISFVLCYNILFAQNAIDISNKMFETVKNINTISFNIVAKERFNENYKVIEANLKKQVSPVRIYYKQIKPNYGAEVLINNIHSKKALVNPNKFPWINIDIPPQSMLLREAQHHSIYEAGLNYFSEILSNLFIKYKSEINNLVKYLGEVKYNNTICYKIEISNPNYKIIKYTVKEDVCLFTLAQTLRINDYQVIELNPIIKNYEQIIKKGTQLTIPNDYAKRLVILINKSTYLPIYMEVYDNKGLYEQYQFNNVKVNVKFNDNDFSETNAEYGFK